MKPRPELIDVELETIELGAYVPGDRTVGVYPSFHRIIVKVEDISDDSLEGLSLDLRILFASWFDTTQDNVRPMSQWRKIWEEEAEDDRWDGE